MYGSQGFLEKTKYCTSWKPAHPLDFPQDFFRNDWTKICATHCIFRKTGFILKGSAFFWSLAFRYETLVDGYFFFSKQGLNKQLYQWHLDAKLCLLWCKSILIWCRLYIWYTAFFDVPGRNVKINRASFQIQDEDANNTIPIFSQTTSYLELGLFC